MLAVDVDYSTESAQIGIEPGRPVPRHEILEALQKIGYSGQFLDEAKAPADQGAPATPATRLTKHDSIPGETVGVDDAKRGTDERAETPRLPAEPFDYAAPAVPATFAAELEVADNTPPHNPLTNAGATLGRVLFYDKNLSQNRSVACASCHLQSHAFADPRRFSVGHQGAATRRNAMGLANARYSNVRGHRPGFFWDERADSLEAQALMPIQDAVEMGMTLDQLEQRLANLPYYPPLFEQAFGAPDVTADRVARAIAQFVRSMVSFDSRYDRAVARAGDASKDFDEFTELENVGKAIFFNGRDGVAEHGCAHCHVPPTFGMPRAMNNGLALRYEDPGLGALGRPPNDPLDPSNDGKFKAPSLRNVALAAPYMHDGRLESLEAVIDHYSDRVQLHVNLALPLGSEDDADSTATGLQFSPRQKAAVVEFLKTLTDEQFVRDPRFSDPFGGE